MSTKLNQLQYRNSVNKFGDKQAVIDQYDALHIELCEMLAHMPNSAEMKTYLRNSLERITEVQTFYTHQGPICIDTYNPDHGSKATTQKKIAALQAVLNTVRKMQSQNRR